MALRLKRSALAAVCAAVSFLGVSWYAHGQESPAIESRVPVAVTVEDMTNATSVSAALEELHNFGLVVAELPDPPGYERDCGSGGGCVFGPAWTDDYSGPGAHNGCDTRNDILAGQLTDVTFKPDTRDCKVLSGVLSDPYTGNRIEFRSGATTSSDIQIDHVFALSRAWDAGAATWPLQTRVAFANDIERNLVAVDGPVNQSKSDSGLDSWLPPNVAHQCAYAARFLRVAADYRLMITTGDESAAHTACALTSDR